MKKQYNKTTKTKLKNATFTQKQVAAGIFSIITEPNKERQMLKQSQYVMKKTFLVPAHHVEAQVSTNYMITNDIAYAAILMNSPNTETSKVNNYFYVTVQQLTQQETTLFFSYSNSFIACSCSANRVNILKRTISVSTEMITTPQMCSCFMMAKYRKIFQHFENFPNFSFLFKAPIMKNFTLFRTICLPCFTGSL